jgi:hypothetical protein
MPSVVVGTVSFCNGHILFLHKLAQLIQYLLYMVKHYKELHKCDINWTRHIGLNVNNSGLYSGGAQFVSQPDTSSTDWGI